MVFDSFLCRSVDLVTPLATQLTYEGLIDELYGISHGTVQFPPHMFPTNDDNLSNVSAEDKKQVILNSNDKLFAELRDKNFRAVSNHNLVGEFLSYMKCHLTF